MRKARLVFLFAFLTVLPAGVLHSKVRICKEVGFFGHFLSQNLKVTGTCDDRDRKVNFSVGPSGLVLNKLANNKAIPINLDSDTKGKVSGVTQFGQGDHTGTVEVVDGSTIKFDLQNQSGGKCSGIAAGGSRCLYDVADEGSCPVLPNDRVCMPCINPCKGYDDFIKVYIQGTPTVLCSMKLNLVTGRCGTCKGKAVIPK